MAVQLNLRCFLALFALGMLTACANQAMTGNNAQTSADEQALQGASPDVLTADFGPPVLLREDGPAQVWLYQTTTCDLDVFLYKDASGTPRVKALLPNDGVSLHSCLLGLTHSTTTAALEHNAAS